MSKIIIYDTTLRDGAQGEGISFSVIDKLKIAERLIDAGADYIEGGWPGSNPKDAQFFRSIRRVQKGSSRIVAFGSTRKPGISAEQDANLRALIASRTPTVTVFGKSWRFHVTDALRVTPRENLEMISDSVRFLKSDGREVIFDAEHFFDGFKADPAYAVETIKAAAAAGADCIVLCDTNGGSMPWEIAAGVQAAGEAVPISIGIHTHNDSELAVANSVVAVQSGAVHVQGTINGYGERCGNANLCSVIPILQLKLHKECLTSKSLGDLKALSNFVDEIANVVPNDRQPFVGRSAFAHKAGIHVDAVRKQTRTYEHIAPEEVGNVRRVLVSELAGASSIIHKAERYGVNLTKQSPEIRKVTREIAELENRGFSFEGAEGSFELLLRKNVGTYEKLFDLKSYRVIVEKRRRRKPITEAVLRVEVKGEDMLCVAEGDGPVHALDGALRKALQRFYPELAHIKLTDFKVRVLNAKDGTAAGVRAIVESTDGTSSWSTVGVSTNIIEASWYALVDSVEYGLLRLMAKKEGA